jgi:ferredoxin-type protein NapG
MANDDKPLDRRQFFRRGLGELLKPIAKSLEPVERVIDEFENAGKKYSSPAARTVPLGVWLRPPGALSESRFLDTCSRCGECVKVCPAEAIKLDTASELGKGAPYIDANTTACVVCDSLACMNNCPTGALVPTPLTQIKMGTAVWREHLCVRSRGESCEKCVDVCPLGSAAIDRVGNQIVVKPLACIGCGLCQQHCPTEPKSITVIPVAARS